VLIRQYDVMMLILHPIQYNGTIMYRN